MAALFRQIGRIARQVGRDARHALLEALERFAAAGGCDADRAVESRDLAGQRVDLHGAELDALDDFLGKAGEIRNAGAGDLSRRREGSEVTQGLQHVDDEAAERLFRLRDARQPLLALVFDGRKGGELGDGFGEAADGGLRGLVVEGTRQGLQRRDQPVQHIEDRQQDCAAVEKALFDLRACAFKARYQRRLLRVMLGSHRVYAD